MHNIFFKWRYRTKNKFMIIKSTPNFTTSHEQKEASISDTFFSTQEKEFMALIEIKLEQEKIKPSPTSLQIIREYHIRTSNKQMATEF